MIMQKLFLHVHVVSVHVCACVYLSSVQTSWRPSVLCGTAMMPTHKTHSTARLMNHSPFTQIYMFIHKQTHAGIARAHRNNYRGSFVYFGNMIFQAQKHWVSYSASFFIQKRAAFQMSFRLIHFLCRRNYNNNEYTFYCSCDKLWCCYALMQAYNCLSWWILN